MAHSRSLIYYGNPLLRKKAQQVLQIDDSIRQIIKDMQELVKIHHGWGISAPQIGESVAIFIIAAVEDTEEPRYPEYRVPGRVFINPKLSEPSHDHWVQDEGCLSIPHIRGEVSRPRSIKITALNEEGKEFTETFTWGMARIAMHENDHLNGVLYIDRLSEKKKRQIEPLLQKLKSKLK